MTRLFWVDGRLSWPLVIAVVFVTASLLAVDFVWRMVVVPFDTLLIYAIMLDGAAAALLIGGYILVRRRRGFREKSRP